MKKPKMGTPMMGVAVGAALVAIAVLINHAHGDLTSLALHERLPELLVVPREKTPTGAAARGNP